MSSRTSPAPRLGSERSAYSTRIGGDVALASRGRAIGRLPVGSRTCASRTAVSNDGVRRCRTRREIVEWWTPARIASWRWEMRAVRRRPSSQSAKGIDSRSCRRACGCASSIRMCSDFIRTDLGRPRAALASAVSTLALQPRVDLVLTVWEAAGLVTSLRCEGGIDTRARSATSGRLGWTGGADDATRQLVSEA